MKEKKTTCPICFTKMQTMDHSLVCPECGYRYCDHNYDNRDLYSTTHAHTPHYTTTSQTTYQSSGNTASQATYTRPANTVSQNTSQPAGQRPVNTAFQNTSGNSAQYQRTVTVENTKAASIVKKIITIYVIIIILSVLIPMLKSLFFLFATF